MTIEQERNPWSGSAIRAMGAGKAARSASREGIGTLCALEIAGGQILAAQRSVSQSAIGEAFGLVRRQVDARRERRQRGFVRLQPVGTGTGVEVGPECARLQVDRALELSGGCLIVPGTQQTPADCVALPDGVRGRLEKEVVDGNVGVTGH